VAIVDIDVHFGNGTADILKGDPRSFFGCVHMTHGEDNAGFSKQEVARCCRAPRRENEGDNLDRLRQGFFPHALGCSEVSENFVSVGVYPKALDNAVGADNSGVGRKRAGPTGFRSALADVIIPQLERFNPELLIISGAPQLPSSPLSLSSCTPSLTVQLPLFTANC
jgi:hypothetical protein